jgi:hypothetical protein
VVFDSRMLNGKAHKFVPPPFCRRCDSSKDHFKAGDKQAGALSLTRFTNL